MKIVIVGAGEVGSHLAKLLSNENQDITLVDEDQEKLATLDVNYNLMTVVGSPTSFKSLNEAGAGQCDLFIAVTPYESNNILSCSLARRLGASSTVARIDTYEFMAPANIAHVRSLGADHVIYPEHLAAEEIITSLRHSWARNWFELHNGKIVLAGVKLVEGAPLAGTQLKELTNEHRYFHVSAIRRNSETIIPRGDDFLLPGDILYITTTRDHIESIPQLCGKSEQRVRRVVVMGGSKMAIRLVNLAGDEFSFKIIEKDLEVCRKLPQQCSKCEIIHGDARDAELLAEIGIDEMDAFVALSGSSETNILSCLTAKEMGIKKTVANVESIQFITQADNLNVDTVVNKKLLASSSIFQLLLDSDANTSKCLALTDAEVAEIEIPVGSKIIGKPVRELRLSKDMTLAGMIRGDEGQLITGNTILEAGDHVLVFCLAGSLHKMEKTFK